MNLYEALAQGEFWTEKPISVANGEQKLVNLKPSGLGPVVFKTPPSKLTRIVAGALIMNMSAELGTAIFNIQMKHESSLFYAAGAEVALGELAQATLVIVSSVAPVAPFAHEGVVTIALPSFLLEGEVEIKVNPSGVHEERWASGFLLTEDFDIARVERDHEEDRHHAARRHPYE